MKKLLPLSILAIASFAQAEEPIYWTSGGTYGLGEFDEFAKAVDGVSTNEITFTHNVKEKVLLTLDHDFEFVSKLNWQCTYIDPNNSKTNMFHMFMDVKNGATVTFNDVAISRARLITRGEATNFAKAIFNKNGSYEKAFYNTHVTAGKNCTSLGSYTHLYNGSTLTSDHDFSLARIYIRTTSFTEKFNGKDIKVAGKIFVTNGATFTIDMFDGNNGGSSNDAYFFFGFGDENTAETFKFTSTDNLYSITNTINKRNDIVVFQDFCFGDTLMTRENLLADDTIKDSLLVEQDGVVSTFKSLVDAGLINVDTTANEGFYTYTMIPEPSTYAGILGALAIAFAFMRRQTRK